MQVVVTTEGDLGPSLNNCSAEHLVALPRVFHDFRGHSRVRISNVQDWRFVADQNIDGLRAECGEVIFADLLGRPPVHIFSSEVAVCAVRAAERGKNVSLPYLSSKSARQVSDIPAHPSVALLVYRIAKDPRVVVVVAIDEIKCLTVPREGPRQVSQRHLPILAGPNYSEVSKLNHGSDSTICKNSQDLQRVYQITMDVAHDSDAVSVLKRYTILKAGR